MLNGLTSKEVLHHENMIGKEEGSQHMAHAKEVELTRATAQVPIEKLVQKDMPSHVWDQK